MVEGKSPQSGGAPHGDLASQGAGLDCSHTHSRMKGKILPSSVQNSQEHWGCPLPFLELVCLLCILSLPITAHWGCVLGLGLWVQQPTEVMDFQLDA